MAHVRQTIREAIATRLRTTPANWGSVLETRIVPTRQVWPFLMVYAVDETSAGMVIDPVNIFDRSVTLSIVGMLKMPGTGDGTAMGETVEDRMDAMAAEIETKLTSSALITGALLKVKSILLQSTEMEVITNEVDGSISHAEMRMAWQVRYMTAEGLPEALF